MKYKFLPLFLTFIQWSNTYSSAVNEDKFIFLEKRDTGNFYNQAIFLSNEELSEETLMAARHSLSSDKSQERVVFDFKNQNIPKIYSKVFSNSKKIFVDFYFTKINPSINSFGKSHYIEKINFYPIESNILTLEIILNEDVKVNMFKLSNPGRLVLDLRKL